MIFYDIDGVVRDLDGYFGNNRVTWNQKNNGKTLVEEVDENLAALVEAPKAVYASAITLAEPCQVPFITVQSPHWIRGTMLWCRKNFPYADVFFVQDFVDKLYFLEDGDYLVDDYPYFPDYSKIILCDWPYNRHVKNPYKRVTSAQELLDVLINIRKEKAA